MVSKKGMILGESIENIVPWILFIIVAGLGIYILLKKLGVI
jgi:hypothetical protein